MIQHVAFEGPGLIGSEARRRGLEVRHHRMDRGEDLPDAYRLGGLVVMGGPMGVADIVEHPYLREEQRLIATAVEQDVPVIGVCLGAQLLAAALGAEVRPGPRPEVGLGAVTLTGAGRDDPVLGPAGPHLPVLHWHGDTFSLPAGATHLAESDLYFSQAFRVGRCAYGLQFHVELDRELATSMAPHLPAGVAIEERGREAVEQSGRGIVARFFDTAGTPLPR